MTKLKNAVQNDFYYEAIFIVYAILEDRTESILKHANIDIMRNEKEKLSLAEKLTKLRKIPLFKEEYIRKHLTPTLIREIYLWKDKRNTLIHDLINAEYNNEDVKTIALEGYELVKTLNNKSTLINKYNDNLLSQKC